MNDKSKKTYKSISEVAKDLNLVNPKSGKLNTHTVRFWEKEFKQIKPKILSGNRRYYDEKNIILLRKVHFLLKNQGMTINGVKKILNKKESLNLDESINQSIRTVNLRNKLSKISKMIKDLKK